MLPPGPWLTEFTDLRDQLNRSHEWDTERLRGLVLSSEALCASAAAQGQPSDTAAAQTALLQLHSLLSVTTAAEPASRLAADGLLQQCTARLHGLTMQRHRSEARWVGGMML